MDYSTFRAPEYSRQQIWNAADGFRATYASPDECPVDIESIVEFDMELEIRPIQNLRQTADVDALLMSSFTAIIVDADAYMRPAQRNRYRFSLAHEIGHYVLHRDLFKALDILSSDDWHAFMNSIPDEEYRWIEWHAYEFAGRLLVPRAPLIRHLNDAVSRYREYVANRRLPDDYLQGDAALEYIASAICRHFEVSHNVISKRLRFEKLWPPDAQH